MNAINVRTALMFPGIGAHYQDMIKKFVESNPLLRSRVEGLQEMGISYISKDFGLKEIASAQLQEQIDIFALSLVIYEQRINSLSPSFLCGHSLGFYAAGVAAGAFSEDVALEIMVNAFCLTHEAFAGSTQCLAVITAYEPIDCNSLGDAGLEVLSLNSLTQVLVYGFKEKVELLRENASHKLIRIDYLSENLPFHSKSMREVCTELRSKCEHLEMSPPIFPLISHITGEVVETAEEVHWHVFGQLERPINWLETILKLKALDVSKIIEVGPNRVLRQFSKWIDSSICFEISDDPKNFSRSSRRSSKNHVGVTTV